MALAAPTFAESNQPDVDLHQYWYSAATVSALVEEIGRLDVSCRLAFLSAPSAFFALPVAVQQRSALFEYDRRWQEHPGFVYFDYNRPLDLPESCRGAFDFALVDPPQLSEEPLRLYRQACEHILRPGGRILLCTVMWNEGLARQIFGASPVPFRPCIDNCTSFDSFAFFANYGAASLQHENSEMVEHPYT